MQANEARALNSEEVQKKLDDAREELFKLRFQMFTGQLRDSSRLRTTRRTIARLSTILRERAIAANLAAQEAK